MVSIHKFTRNYRDIKFVIIVVTYNAERFISELLASVLNLDYDLSRVMLTLIDNASIDKTFEKSISILKKQGQGHLQYLLIKFSTNIGFAIANNVAFELVRKLFGKVDDKVFILINPDTKILSKEFLKIAELLTKYFPIVGFAMLSGEKNVIDSIGAFIDWLGNPCDILCGVAFSKTIKNLCDNLPNVYFMPYVCFAAVAIRGDALEKLGFLRDEYIMYFEDTEWCLRAWYHGIPVVVCKNFMVWHVRGGTQKKMVHGFHIEKIERLGSVEPDIPMHYAKNSLLLTYEYLGLHKFVLRILLYLLASLIFRRKYLSYSITEALRIILRRRVRPKRIPKGLVLRNPKTWVLLWTLKCLLNRLIPSWEEVQKCIVYGYQRASLEYLRYRFLKSS